MKDYVCTVRGYIYQPKLGDPDAGINAGTDFKDIPPDWECPDCGSAKEDFEELE
jgi:rubredoxin